MTLSSASPPDQRARPSFPRSAARRARLADFSPAIVLSKAEITLASSAEFNCAIASRWEAPEKPGAIPLAGGISESGGARHQMVGPFVVSIGSRIGLRRYGSVAIDGYPSPQVAHLKARNELPIHLSNSRNSNLRPRSLSFPTRSAAPSAEPGDFLSCYGSRSYSLPIEAVVFFEELVVVGQSSAPASLADHAAQGGAAGFRPIGSQRAFRRR